MVVDGTELLSIPASYLPGTPKAAVRSVPLGTTFLFFSLSRLFNYHEET
jgi:hypothetical protein